MDEETLQFYRSNAQGYAARKIAKYQRLTRFLALLHPGGTILELGCGAGADSAQMLAAGFDVDTSDGSPERLRATYASAGNWSSVAIEEGGVKGFDNEWAEMLFVVASKSH